MADPHFWTALVKDGEIKVNKDTEVAQAMNSNPRTAIGQVSYLHYLIIVSDGRTSKSKGLSLYQLANLFQTEVAQQHITQTAVFVNYVF